MDATDRKLAADALEITKQQLLHKYWLVYFEDFKCSVVWSRSDSVCMDIRERLYVKVRFFS